MAHLEDVRALISISIRALFTIGILDRHIERSYSTNQAKDQKGAKMSNSDPHGSIRRGLQLSLPTLLFFSLLREGKKGARWRGKKGRPYKLDAPGMRIAVTLRIRRLVLSCAVVWMKPCSAKRVPPAKKHIPRTRSRFESIEPITTYPSSDLDRFWSDLRILTWEWRNKVSRKQHRSENGERPPVLNWRTKTRLGYKITAWKRREEASRHGKGADLFHIHTCQYKAWCTITIRKKLRRPVRHKPEEVELKEKQNGRVSQKIKHKKEGGLRD